MSEAGTVRFGDSLISYDVVRSTRRRKTIEITVEQPGRVLVAAPMDTSTERIEATLRRRAGWIVRHNGTSATSPPPRRFVSGESLPYLGRSVRLNVRPTAADDVSIRFHHWQFDVDVPSQLHGLERRSQIRRAFEDWYRNRAAMKLPARVENVARLLGVRPKSVLIRNQRVRWASCGPDGTLRFNWRVLMTKPALIDYVVAHELAHLRFRPHSSDYWAVVSQAVPDYRLRRAELAEAGSSLDL